MAIVFIFYFSQIRLTVKNLSLTIIQREDEGSGHLTLARLPYIFIVVCYNKSLACRGKFNFQKL